MKHPDTGYRGELFQGVGIVASNHGALLDPRIDLLNLTEIFHWGDGLTIGARQLSFALLLDFVEDEPFAQAYFERFAHRVIIPLETKWVMVGADIMGELKAMDAQGAFDFGSTDAPTTENFQ